MTVSELTVKNNMKKQHLAICPGSFDPVTYGHLDIINRTAGLFDKVIVLVSFNALKNGGTFTIDERVDFIRRCISLPNVEVDRHDGLLVDYARAAGASAIVKGLRAVSDYEDEFQQALINKQLAPEVDTIFMATNSEYMYLSSSAVRQVCFFGGDISAFVPPQIEADIIAKIKHQKGER